ncbi:MULTISPECIES: hypothetical protein [unclassified Amycolatopsis]|uniref:hypothetical protein n=1 Tax=unclassified Amycolatopsis TaxID=2618356 RepID=UPI001C6A6225|nr:hypothetical protein [Amycolatopsis sp. DSM 110486]QYN18484.1 hypothetical protein K1T34_37925 [Amycolatopsis sp. DSM 110486]
MREETFTPDLYVRYFRDLREFAPRAGRPVPADETVEIMARYHTEPATTRTSPPRSPGGARGFSPRSCPGSTGHRRPQRPISTPATRPCTTPNCAPGSNPCACRWPQLEQPDRVADLALGDSA